jgi:hypothetical protein
LSAARTWTQHNRSAALAAPTRIGSGLVARRHDLDLQAVATVAGPVGLAVAGTVRVQNHRATSFLFPGITGCPRPPDSALVLIDGRGHPVRALADWSATRPVDRFRPSTALSPRREFVSDPGLQESREPTPPGHRLGGRGVGPTVRIRPTSQEPGELPGHHPARPGRTTPPPWAAMPDHPIMPGAALSTGAGTGD